MKTYSINLLALDVISHVRVDGANFPRPDSSSIGEYFTIAARYNGVPINFYPNQGADKFELVEAFIGKKSVSIIPSGTKRGADFRGRLFKLFARRAMKARLAADLGITIGQVTEAHISSASSAYRNLLKGTFTDPVNLKSFGIDNAVTTLTDEPLLTSDVPPMGTVINIDADFDSDATNAGSESEAATTLQIIVDAIGNDSRRGQVRFPLSSIPNGATINDSDLQFNVTSETVEAGEGVSICLYDGAGDSDPDVDSGANKFSNSTGTVLVNIDCATTGSKTGDLGTSADSAISGNLASLDRISFGLFPDAANDAGEVVTIEAIENSGTDPPTLTVDYTEPNVSASMVCEVATATAASPNSRIIPVTSYGVALRATTNLISHYMFFSPDRLIDSVGVNDLTATGTPTYGAGEIDDAAILNGSTQWYKAGDVAAFELQDGSVEAIFFADDVTNEKYIVSKETSGFAGWDLRVQGGLLKFRIGSGGAHFELTSAVSVSTWYHAVATWDAGGLIKLYINGTEVDSDTGPASVAYGTEQFAIGLADYGGSNIGPFDGQIDEVAVYGKILTSTEVTDHATAAGFGAVSANMVAALTTASAAAPNADLLDNEFILAEPATATALSPNASYVDNEFLVGVLSTATAASPNGELTASSLLEAVLTTATAVSPNTVIGNSANFEAENTTALAEALEAAIKASSVLEIELATATAISPNGDLQAVVGLLSDLAIATALALDAGLNADYTLAIAVATASAVSPETDIITTSPFNAVLATATIISPDGELIANSILSAELALATALAFNITPIANSSMAIALATATALAFNATIFTPSNMIVALAAAATAVSPEVTFKASGRLKIQNATAVVSSTKGPIGSATATVKKPIGQAKIRGNYHGS